MAQQRAAEYAWPSLLVRPQTGLRLVYLDLNHWISLAKASTGHRDGDQHQDALTAVRDAAASGAVVFPLSATHYMEMAGIQDPRQRADIASVMEELSGFTTLIDRVIIMRYELETALDAVSASVPPRYEPMPLLNHGVGPAFGRRGRLRIRSTDGEDVTESHRAEWKDGSAAFDARLSEAERQLERAVLQGPSDAEVPILVLSGWDPTVARAGAEQRAEQERQQATRLDAEPRWRRGRLRDVMAVRYLTIELMELLNEAFAARGLTIEDVFTSKEATGHFVDVMPSADVYVTLTTAAHRNRDKSWEPNDIFDIDALSIAVPYCDIVVTERHASHVLRTAHMPTKVGTEIVTKLSDLVSWLQR
ncbi:hypothetical protein [Streptomyces sp. NPDC029004]|uniref:hypothetical protein n=1 Tax=Streptomyces sp. NPDC029004 TaxID=3154490 RepID=UPI0033F539CF